MPDSKLINLPTLHAALASSSVFASAPMRELVSDKPIEKNWIEELCEMPDFNNLKNNRERLFDQATYTHQESLQQSLEIVYRRLRGDYDAQLGELTGDGRAAIIAKLEEGASMCIEGLHDRVQEIKSSFVALESFEQLLQVIREDLVQRIAASLTNEVHATNTIIAIASTNGYGVRARNRDDRYYGQLTEAKIKLALANGFYQQLTPYHLVFLICDYLKSLVGGVSKSHVNDYSSASIEKIVEYIKTFLLNEAEKQRMVVPTLNSRRQVKIFQDQLFLDELTTYYFEIKNTQIFFPQTGEEDSDDNYVKQYTDLNWLNLQKKIFQKLFEEHYFAEQYTSLESCKNIPLISLLDFAAYSVLISDDPIELKNKLDELVVFLKSQNKLKDQLPFIARFCDIATKNARNALFALFANIDFMKDFCNKISVAKWPADLLKNTSIEIIYDVLRQSYPDETITIDNKVSLSNNFMSMMNDVGRELRSGQKLILGKLELMFAIIDKSDFDPIYQGVGNSGWMWLMNMLCRVADKKEPSLVSGVINILEQLIGKVNRKQVGEVIAGFNGVATSYNEGMNVWSALVKVLPSITQENDRLKCVAVLMKLIDEAIAGNEIKNVKNVKNVITGFNRIVSSPSSSGAENALTFLLEALNDANNTSGLLSSMITVLHKLITQGIDTNMIDYVVTVFDRADIWANLWKTLDRVKSQAPSCTQNMIDVYVKLRAFTGNLQARNLVFVKVPRDPVLSEQLWLNLIDAFNYPEQKHDSKQKYYQQTMALLKELITSCNGEWVAATISRDTVWNKLENALSSVLSNFAASPDMIKHSIEIILMLTTVCKSPDKSNLFARQTDWRSEFTKQDKMKTLYFKLFDFLKQSQQPSSPCILTISNFYPIRTLFLETGIPKDYLKVYLQEKRSTLTAADFEPDTHLGRLVDGVRGETSVKSSSLFKSDKPKTKTRELVESIFPKNDGQVNKLVS